MKKALVLCVLALCATQYGYGQKHHTGRNDFKRHEIGTTGSFAVYNVTDLFFGYGATRYTAGQVGLSYHYRPKKHFQLGLNGDLGINNAGGNPSRGAFSMSFPIGDGSSYMYPGWHISYLTIEGEGWMPGLGIHLGVAIAINDWVALTIQGDKGILFLGHNTSVRSGVCLRL